MFVCEVEAYPTAQRLMGVAAAVAPRPAGGIQRRDGDEMHTGDPELRLPDTDRSAFRTPSRAQHGRRQGRRPGRGTELSRATELSMEELYGGR